MGIFNFLKRKEKIVQIPLIKSNEEGEYVIKHSDFIEKVHHSKIVRNVKILTPDFEKEFAHLIVGKPMKKGEIIELKSKYITIEIWNQIVEVEFDVEEPMKNLNEFVEKINNQLNWLSKNVDLVNKNIIHHLFNLKNQTWLLENQQPISTSEFIKSIKLNSIYFCNNSSYSLIFEDGNLFNGHCIEVKINSNSEIKKVNLEG